jgi:hypothetical protein
MIKTTQWEQQIRQALESGKGKYAWSFARDLHNYLKIIHLIRQNKHRKAAYFADGLDTAAREEIPDKIYDTLMEYRDEPIYNSI